MIVEFIGNTGAGKTTLLKAVQGRLAEKTQVTDSISLVTGLLGLRNVMNPTAQNLIQEFVSLPFFLRSLHRHQAFLVYTVRLFSRNTHFSIATINNLRSLERKIGACEIARRYTRDRIILVDEGPILAAHMFVFARTLITSQDISHFSALVPMPDLIVYIKAPMDSLLKRSLQRSDPPSQMRSKDPALVEEYLERAVLIFEELIRTERFRGLVLTVENPESTGDERDAVVADISEHILNHEASKQGLLQGRFLRAL